MTDRQPAPQPGIIWASLPIPAFLVGADDRITEANPAAEDFLKSSAR